MRARWLLLGLLPACGRIGFSSAPDGEVPNVAVGDGAARDGARDAFAEAGPVDPTNVALYSMDGLTSSDSLTDTSGYGNNGSCIGASCPTPATGVVGGALQFDGADDIVRVPYSASLGTAQAFTIAAWFNLTTLQGASYACFVNKPIAGSTADSWQLCVSNNDELFGSMYDRNANSINIGGTTKVANKTWNHSALTWDGATATLYLNGGSQGGAAASSVELDASPLTIGADLDSPTPSAQFEGALDDIRIYDRALSPAEIAALASR